MVHAAVERLDFVQFRYRNGYLIIHLQQGHHIHQTQTVKTQSFLDVCIRSDVTYLYFKLTCEQLINLLNNFISCHN